MPEGHEQLQARIRELEKELRHAHRSVRQMQLQSERSETVALRSRLAILGTNRELQASVLDLERLTAELLEAKSRAERASEAKGRFVATISHELRTPMNGILGTAELLRHGHLGEDERELADIIHRSARGLLQIINDVLDYTKIESDRLELEEVDFDLHKTLRAVVDLELNAARRCELQLGLTLASDVPQVVTGDPVRLRQVLLNLLDNAIKFTHEGRVELIVEQVCGCADRTRFTVEDTGIGFDPAVTSTIFEPFTQAESTTTRRFGGSGLGLAICRRIVSQMGGEMRVASEPGCGSSFSFECTLPPTSSPAGKLRESDSALLQGEPLGLRVLVVDDNAVNRLIAQRMLARLGCDAAVVEGGREALRALEDGSFEAVLMDCSMPNMDGFEATARIRELPGDAARVRVIAMTAHAMSGDREHCLNHGMDGYLSKPMQLRELRRALRARGSDADEAAA